MPVPHPRIDTGSPGLCWGKERQTVYVHVPLMIGTEVYHNPGIPAFVGNPISCVRAGGNDSMSSASSGNLP